MLQPASQLAPRRNLPYASHDGQQLLLDFYPAINPRAGDTVPAAAAGMNPDHATGEPVATPLVLYIHDGGWKAGSKDDCPLRWLTRHGYAVASINYRLAPKHRFPAPLFDARDALRYLCSRAESLNVDPDRVAVAGVSSGAHLACLLALTGEHPDLRDESRGMGDDEVFCRVRAVINYYGFTDLVVMRDRRSRRINGGANAPETGLLGHTVAENPARARLASPLYHVAADKGKPPPFLHLHGDLNEIVPLDQTRRFHAALEEAGATSKLILVRGAGHGGPLLFTHRSIRDRIAEFLDKHL